MQPRSTLARLQQVSTLCLFSGAGAWCVWLWPRHPSLAAAGALAIVMGYSLVLALEFLAVRFLGASDSPARPTWVELTRAWLGATVAGARVFYWRQPFRWRAVPDRDGDPAQLGRRGAVFIHGFACNRGFWNPWLRRLEHLEHPFIAVNLEPVSGSIDEYVPIIEEAVKRIEQVTGMPPVLVCHSMGGIAARAWLVAMSAGHRVHRVITIASPHAGTWLARFSRMKNGRQMRPDGEWIGELARRTVPAWNTRFTCWYSNCDNVIFPSASATLEGGDNRLVLGMGHVALAFHPKVMAESLAMISS